MKAPSWIRCAVDEAGSRRTARRAILGIAVVAAVVCLSPATALAGQITVTHYDVRDTPASGSGGWAHAYGGTITDTGYFFTTFASCSPQCRVVDETGGSGSLNDGDTTGDTQRTQLLTTRDATHDTAVAPTVRPIRPELTLYLAGVSQIRRIRIYANSFGVLGRATVEIGGTAATVNVVRSGTLEVLDLTNTPLAAIATDRIVLRDLVGDPYDQVSIAEIVVDGANDSRGDPDVIPNPLPATVTGNTAQATTDPGDPIPLCSIGAVTGTVWYSYTPPVTGTYGSNLVAGAGTNPIASFYSADASGNLTQRTCTVGGQASFTLTAGQTYLIMVGEYAGCCSPGPFTLTLTPPPPPQPPLPNDARSNALVIANGIATGDTSRATADPTDPTPFCSFGALTGTLWYSYTPATTGNFAVSLAGIGSSPIASVYTADAAGNLTQRFCTVGGSATFALTAGQTYLIMVGQPGFGIPGPFTLTLTPPPDTTRPVITPHVSGTLGPGGWYTSNVTVSWTVVEPESASTLQTTGCGPTTIASDTTAAGITLVCRATSAGGTSLSAVTIRRDATPPVVTVPTEGVTVDAVGPQGAPVVFAATAFDAVGGAMPVSCAPPSGSVFPVGDTTVTCSATDAHGNAAGGSFVVHVKGAGEQIADLKTLVGTFTTIPKSTRDELLTKLKAAGDELDRNHLRASCDRLRDFVRTVTDKTPKQISVDQSNQLVGAATRIRAVLACS